MSARPERDEQGGGAVALAHADLFDCSFHFLRRREYLELFPICDTIRFGLESETDGEDRNDSGTGGA